MGRIKLPLARSRVHFRASKCLERVRLLWPRLKQQLLLVSLHLVRARVHLESVGLHLPRVKWHLASVRIHPE